MYKCMGCGKELQWSADFNLDDVFGEEYEDVNGFVGIYSCRDCELDYQIASVEEDGKVTLKIEITNQYDDEESE